MNKENSNLERYEIRASADVAPIIREAVENLPEGFLEGIEKIIVTPSSTYKNPSVEQFKETIRLDPQGNFMNDTISLRFPQGLADLEYTPSVHRFTFNKGRFFYELDLTKKK